MSLPEQPARARALPVVMTAAGVCVTLLHLFGAISPSPLRWGMHSLAFLPAAAASSILLAMGALLLAPVQRTVLAWLEALATRLHRPAFPLVVASSLALFWLARERFYLLGDGTLVVRLVKQLASVENVASSFPHEPLSGFLLWRCAQACSAIGFLPTEEFPVQLVSILAGGVALILVRALSRRLVTEPVDRLLLGLFLVAGGGSQLFFGYVENYAPLAAGFLLFLLLSIRYLQGGGSLALPAMAFGLLFTLHFSMLAMVPSLGMLLHSCHRRKRWAEIPAALFSMVAVTAGLLWLCGYSLASFTEILLKTGTHLLPLGSVTLPQQAYTMFSSRHAAELGNLLMLLSPFALVIPLLVMATGRGRGRRGDSLWLFLLAAAGGGVVFAFVANLDLGMSRDWDVLATYAIGLVLLAGTFWLTAVPDVGVRRRLMVMVVGLTLLPSVGWIAVNASEERALARFETLPDLRVWGRSAVTAAYEELAVFYRRRMDAAKAVEYFRRYIAIDSGNGRIWSGLAYVYSLTADTENEMLAYERAVACHTTILEAYLSLSTIYANQGRLDEALAAARLGVELHPASAIANNNCGAIMLRKELPSATTLPYFLRAIELDPDYADAYYNAGLCSYDLKDISSARRYLTRYLAMSPDPESAALARKILAQVGPP